jgi:hypothetical protein
MEQEGHEARREGDAGAEKADMGMIPILLIDAQRRTLAVSLKGYRALLDAFPRAKRTRIGALVEEIRRASATHTPLKKNRWPFPVPQQSFFPHRQQAKSKSKE